MQPIWVTLHPTLNYSKRLPTQTPVTKWVWTKIFLPVSRRARRRLACSQPGWGKAAGPLPDGGQPADVSRGAFLCLLQAFQLSQARTPSAFAGLKPPAEAEQLLASPRAARSPVAPHPRAQPNREGVRPAPPRTVTLWLQQTLFRFLG